MTSSDDPGVPRTRLHAQVDHLVESFRGSDPGHELHVHPGDWRGAGVDHICRHGVLLVRDEDLPRVQAHVGGIPVDSLINGVTVLSVEGEDVQDLLNRVDSRHGVGVATPDHVLYVTMTGTTCPATEPEETEDLDPTPAVRTDRGEGFGVLVSVVDTGLIEGAPAAHSWLEGVIGTPWEQPLGPDGQIRPYAGHGTFVAGVVRSMAPGAEVVVTPVLNRAGAVFESDLVRALDDALDEAPDIISLSAGCTSRHNLPLLGFERFWERRLSHYAGVALVTAAGNDSTRRPFWPAAFPWAVSVGALDSTESHRAHFSNYGGWVDVYARGEGLVNAFATGSYTCQEPPNRGEQRTFKGMCRWSGTSFSTPLVTGMVAARMRRARENGRQAADALLASARTGGTPGVGPLLPSSAAASS